MHNTQCTMCKKLNSTLPWGLETSTVLTPLVVCEVVMCLTLYTENDFKQTSDITQNGVHFVAIASMLSPL